MNVKEEMELSHHSFLVIYKISLHGQALSKQTMPPEKSMSYSFISFSLFENFLSPLQKSTGGEELFSRNLTEKCILVCGKILTY